MSQVNTNAATAAPKQLKKNDFLAVVGTEPMTRGEVVEKLEGYSYIGSYLDYLIDHFANQGKLIVNEDGTFQLKGKKGTVATGRDKHQVVKDEDGSYRLVTETIAKGEHLTKDSGWYHTASKAVKVARQEVFAQYKADTAAINALLPEAAPAETAEAAE